MVEMTRTPATGWRNWFSRVFGMDLRSLAVFRICLAVVVLFDAITRFPDAEAFYSDGGLFDRAASHDFVERYYTAAAKVGTWSLNWLNGEVWWAQSLFVVEAVAACCLLLGFGTRLATILLWMLVVSQHIRNPLVITSGDTLLKLMLFWSIFLPLDRVWSLAARKRGVSPQNIETWLVSIATAGFMLQVILMYFFTGIAKFNDIWFGGHAMDYVLRLELYITDFGRWMLQFPGLLKWVAWGTLLIELAGIWLLLLPWRNSFWRSFNILAFWGFHIGIALCMNIGLFPLICMVAWLPLLPREVWTRQPLPQPTTARITEWQRLCLVAGGIVIATTLWMNLSNLSKGPFHNTLPSLLASGVRMLGLEQHFQMFGIPPNQSPWFVYETRLKDGSKIDLFRPDNRLDLERPADIPGTFPRHNWRKLHQNLVDERLAPYRAALLEYAVRKWNATHSPEQQVQAATLRCYIERTGPDFNPIERWTSVWGTYRDPNAGAGSLFDEFEERLDKTEKGFPF